MRIRNILIAVVAFVACAASPSVFAADEHAPKGADKAESEIKKSKLPIELSNDGKKVSTQKAKNEKSEPADDAPKASDKKPAPKHSGSEMALRQLKLGITYREAKNYAESFNCLNKAYKHFKKSGNRYWIAACYENFGYLYRDLDSLDLAFAFLREARNIYGKMMRGDKGSAAAVADILGIPEHERTPGRKEKVTKHSKSTAKSATKHSATSESTHSKNAELHKAVNQLGENDLELYGMIRTTNERLDAIDRDMREIKESLGIIIQRIDKK